jgi:hypothetical protein
MHRVLALLVAVGLAAAPAGAGEAVRDAALVVIALRQTRTADGRRDVLSRAFDSAVPSQQAPEPAEIPGDRVRARNWFIPVYTGTLPPGVVTGLEVKPPSIQPEQPDPFAAAFEASLYPWRALVDAAWGGSWGATTIKILQGGQDP